jgi:hypothetical protein
MAPDRWFDDRWERYTSAEFLKRVPDKYDHYCAYAKTFHEWTTNLVTNATTNPDVISINQAKVQLSDKLIEWLSYVPKHHRERTGSRKGHACIFHVFLDAYHTLKVAELSLTPPLLFLPKERPTPPPPPPRQITGIFLGDVDDDKD